MNIRLADQQPKPDDSYTIVIDKPPEVTHDPSKVYNDMLKKMGAGEEKKPEQPKMHDVFLLNDFNDRRGTPFDVVVQVMRDIFHKDEREAFNLMMKAHQEGKAFIVKMTKEVAEESCRKVREAAGRFPLQCDHQPED